MKDSQAHSKVLRLVRPCISFIARHYFLVVWITFLVSAAAYTLVLLSSGPATRTHKLPPLYHPLGYGPSYDSTGKSYDPVEQSVILKGAPDNTSFRFKVSGTARLPAPFFEHLARLSLFIESTEARILDAELVLPAGSCQLQMSGVRPLGEDRLAIDFAPHSPCQVPIAESADFDLTLRAKGPHLSLWGYEHDTPILDVLQEGICVNRFCLGGEYRLQPPSRVASRLELLAHTWGFPDQRSLAMLLILGGLILATGLALASYRMRLGRATSLRTGFATFAIALGFGWLMALTVPPYQGPDEPSHFQGFAHLAGLDLEASAQEMAKRGHFMRIRFNAEERFVSEDLNTAFPVPWGHGQYAVDSPTRSGLAPTIWRGVSGLVAKLPRDRVLLALRLVAATVLALAFGIAGMVMQRGGAGQPEAILPLYALLALPSIVFFGSGVSDYAFMVSGYVLTAGFIATVYAGGRLDWAQAAVLGLGLAMVLSAPRSGLLTVPFYVGVLLLGPWLSDRSSASGRDFWAALMVGLLWIFVFYEPRYIDTLRQQVLGDSAGLMSRLFEQLENMPGLILGGATAVFCMLGYVNQRMAQRRKSTPPAPDRSPLLVRRLAQLATAWIGFSLLYSQIARSPRLVFIQLSSEVDVGNMPVTAFEYLGSALHSLVFFFRVENFDTLLQTTFFGGFGWLDTDPPKAFLLTIILFIALGTLGLIWTRFVRAARPIPIAAATIVGLSATVGLYALFNYRVGLNLHGRYLLGFYLTALGIVFSSFPELARTGSRAVRQGAGIDLPPAVFVALGLTFCLAMNAFCLAFLLGRYF